MQPIIYFKRLMKIHKLVISFTGTNSSKALKKNIKKYKLLKNKKSNYKIN